jgi:hypothetical protein
MNKYGLAIQIKVKNLIGYDSNKAKKILKPKYIDLRIRM